MRTNETKALVQAAVDEIFQGKGHGAVAKRLLANGMNVNALRTNDTLRKDEWKQYDMAVIKAAQDRLVGVADLMSGGLTYSLANGLGKTVLEYETESDMEDAEVSMDAVTRARNDRVEYEIAYLPLPVIHKEFQINIRVLNASRTTGESLDTTQAAIASQKVSDKIEEYLFQGSSTFTYGGGTIYGYMDFPNRNTVTLSTQWDASAANGTTVLNDVLAMKQASIDAKHYGPFNLYIPTNYEVVLDDEFKTNSDRTIRERVGAIEAIRTIKVADKLSSDNVILVQMTQDVVRLVEGLPITTVEWQTEGNMIFHFKVMAISIPQIRADQESNCGVTHLA